MSATSATGCAASATQGALRRPFHALLPALFSALAAGTAWAAGAGLEDTTATLELPPLGGAAFSSYELGQLVARLAIAALIGAFLALHPLRRRASGDGRRARRMAQTQVILTIAAALMVLVINDSFERAMGLVGLGSFIRFRNVVSNPVETALIFVHIGLGMTCGLGQFWLGGVSALAFWGLLIPILLWGKDEPDSGEIEEGPRHAAIVVKAKGQDAQALAACIEEAVEESAGASLLSLRERRDDGRVQARVRIGAGEAVERWVKDLRARMDPLVTDIQWGVDEGET